MKILVARISLVLLLLQTMSFTRSERRVYVVFHHYLHHRHLQSFDNFKSYCKSACDNNKTTTCGSQCETYFDVCLKEYNNLRECYKTNESTCDDTTFIPFTTPNIVQFMIDNESMTLENAFLTINVTNHSRSFLIDSYSIDINQNTTLKRAIYNGSKRNSQIDISIIILSFSCNYYVTNCTGRDNKYGHYICDHYGNKICRNGYINPKNNCTQKNDIWKWNSSLVTTTWTTTSSSNVALSVSYSMPSATSTASNISPCVNYQDDDNYWKLTAIVSLTLCCSLVMSWIILTIVLCSCKLKMKGKDDRVDAGNSSGINNLTYEQTIISTTDSYVPSTIEAKVVHTYDTRFEPPPNQNISTGTNNADYNTLFDDNV